MYKKITNEGYSFYIHILKVLPTFLLQESSARWHSWPINMTEYGYGEGVTQSSPLQTAVDTNLEMYRNLKYTVYTYISGTKILTMSLSVPGLVWGWGRREREQIRLTMSLSVPVQGVNLNLRDMSMWLQGKQTGYGKVHGVRVVRKGLQGAGAASLPQTSYWRSEVSQSSRVWWWRCLVAGGGGSCGQSNCRVAGAYLHHHSLQTSG